MNTKTLSLIAALTLLVSVAAACSALIRGEMKHRDAAVLDPLTGLLNRQALELWNAKAGNTHGVLPLTGIRTHFCGRVHSVTSGNKTCFGVCQP